MEELASSGSSSERNLTGLRISNPSTPLGDRWAIIIGISKYKDERLRLKYAHRDAEELYNLITKPSGGGFEKEHIFKLIDEKATRDNINKALRSFLKKPAKDDLVLIYFACHGSYDLDRPNNVYLLPYDTDPDDIASTAVPMREIDASLGDNLLSEKVVIIADACHSASIGKGIGRRSSSITSTAVVNRYLENVSKSRGGIALLTSAQSNEVAFENEKWGEGHGAFTYYLLEGMRGNADVAPQDGIVTVGELFEYVRENVKRATGNQQHPSVGPNAFDENLPMAITAGITAQEYFQLGCLLYELGLNLEDKRRLESANRQFYESIRLAKLDSIPFPKASLQLGKSLMAINDNIKAIETFEEAINACNRTNTIVPSEIFIHLGMAYSKINNYSKAVDSFKRILEDNPQDENAPWIMKYVEYLEKPNKNSNTTIGKKYALLIGISDYSQDSIPKLEGPPNDVQEIKEVLIQKMGFEESNITILSDNAKTTKKSIINAINYLASIATTIDIVLIYYSGHSFNEDYAYIIPSDAIGNSVSSEIQNAISPDELDYLVSRLSSSTTLIADSISNERFLNLAKKDRNYTLLVPAGIALEHQIGNKKYGIFTYCFSKGISYLDNQNLTYSKVINYIVEKSRDEFKKIQTPILICKNNDDTIFSQQSFYLKLFDFAQLKTFSLYTYSELQTLYHILKEDIGPYFAKAYYSFGCAFLEKEKYEEAYEALHTAISISKIQNPKIIYYLAISQLQNKHYNESILSLKQYIQLNPESRLSLESSIEKIKSISNGQKCALLIGINNYINPEIPQIKGAMNDVLALKKVLIEKFDFKEENITMLLDGQATYDAILKSFKDLVKYSETGPAIFYFAGAGSYSREEDNISYTFTDQIKNPILDDKKFSKLHESLSIVSVDGRLEGVYDIYLKELSSLSINRNLITVIDANWNHGGDRNALADERKRPTPRRISLAVPVPKEIFFERG